jgi:CDP-paratose 2-epimerase
MRVFVTGGCGFLGSHVCEYYITQGAEVISYDNLTKYELKRTGFAADEARNHNWDFLMKRGVKLVRADIRNYDELLDNASGSNYIIHTAAQPAMTIGWEDPRLDITTNVIGTFNVLEAARKLKIPVASCATIHVYGNTINETLSENKTRYVRKPAEIDEHERTLDGTVTPLHASKASGDIYHRAYIDTYKLEAASFRLTGIYGTRQFGGEDHGWVANFAIRAIMGWQSTIYGTGKQVRDIIYASDVCGAFDAFYKKRQSGIYNIGGGSKTAISLLECFNILEDILGIKPDVKFGNARHGDLSYFICNINKAKAQLGWEPNVMPREGIAMLIEWIKSNIDLFKGDGA